MKKTILSAIFVLFLTGFFPCRGWAVYTSSTKVNLIISASDQGSGMGSGAEMRFSNDGLTWSPVEPFAGTVSNWDLTAFGGGAEDGEKNVYLKLKDAAGNWTTEQMVANIFLDRVIPVVTASPAGGIYSQPQTVTLIPSEPGNIYYTTDGSTPTTSSTKYGSPILLDASSSLKVLIVDLAGREGLVVTEVYEISIDTDLDGMPDAWEIAYGLDPNVNDADLDNDNDGFTNLEEYLAGWNPTHIGVTLFVDDNAPSGGDGTEQSPFVTISTAMGQAIQGDTILVLEGNYAEGSGIVMKEGVALVTEMGYQTTIDLQNTGFIEGADYSTISGFKIIRPVDTAAAINCVDSSPTIYNNVIIPSQVNAAGILIANSPAAQIHKNTILDAYAGIEINSASPTIKNNVIIDNELGVLMHSGTPLLDYNCIWGNIGTPDCPDGDYCGVTPGPHDTSQDPRFWSP